MPDFTSNAGEGNSALFTDLYELSMMQSYFYRDMNEQAVFSLFVRKLPSSRNFLLSCGLEDVLQYLENLEFTEDDINFLRSLDKFQDEFLEWLKDFRFTGDVYALPEGTPIFANEPLLEIIAPVREAQLLETYILNQIHFQTLAATKAARIVSAAQGIPVIDFGVRRMHGYDAGIKAPGRFISRVYKPRAMFSQARSTIYPPPGQWPTALYRPTTGKWMPSGTLPGCIRKQYCL